MHGFIIMLHPGVPVSLYSRMEESHSYTAYCGTVDFVGFFSLHDSYCYCAVLGAVYNSRKHLAHIKTVTVDPLTTGLLTKKG